MKCDRSATWLFSVTLELVNEYCSILTKYSFNMKDILIIFIFSSFLSVCDVSYGQGAAPWYENLPAVAMDYKVHIDPGKEDCYFQYVNPGATFYVSFQVNLSFIVYF